MLKKYEWRLFVKLAALFLLMAAAAWLLMNKKYLYVGLLVPVLLFLMYIIYQMLKKAQDEVQRLTDRTIQEIERLVQGKEAEVLAV